MFSIRNSVKKLFKGPSTKVRRRKSNIARAETCEVRMMLSAVSTVPQSAVPVSSAALQSAGQSLLSLAVLNQGSGTYPINFTGPFGGTITGSVTINAGQITESLIYTSPSGQKWMEQGSATIKGSTVTETINITSPGGQTLVESGTFTLANTATGKTLDGTLTVTGPNGKTVAATVNAGISGGTYHETVTVTGPNGGKFQETAKIAQVNGKTNVDLTIVGPQGTTLHLNFNIPPKQH